MAKNLNRNDMIEVLDILEGKLSEIFQYQEIHPTYYLMGGSCIVLDDLNNLSYATTKDLDMLWFRNYFHDTILIDHLNRGKYQCITRGTIYEDEQFIGFDIYPEKYQIELISAKLVIDKNNNYSQKDLEADINEYYINERFNHYKYIRVCNAYIPWYTRLVMARLDDKDFRVGINNILEDDHILKSISNINISITQGLINKIDVYDNIGYLVNKYHGNNELVLRDFDIFMSEIQE